MISFTASVTNGQAPLIVYLSDTSMPAVRSWTWNISPAGYAFIYGTSATSQNPAVMFFKPGTFTITLTSGTFTSQQTTLTIRGATSLFNVEEHQFDNLLHTGYDYKGNIFKNTLSSFMFRDPKRAGILMQLENVVHRLINSVKRIKTFVEYAVDKDNTTIN